MAKHQQRPWRGSRPIVAYIAGTAIRATDIVTVVWNNYYGKIRTEVKDSPALRHRLDGRSVPNKAYNNTRRRTTTYDHVRQHGRIFSVAVAGRYWGLTEVPYCLRERGPTYGELRRMIQDPPPSAQAKHAPSHCEPRSRATARRAAHWSRARA